LDGCGGYGRWGGGRTSRKVPFTSPCFQRRRFKKSDGDCKKVDKGGERVGESKVGPPGTREKDGAAQARKEQCWRCRGGPATGREGERSVDWK